MKKLFNILGFQLGWWACVIGVKIDLIYFGPIMMMLFIIYHFIFGNNSRNDIILILTGLFFGIIIDGIFKYTGFIIYLGDINNSYFPPIWIISMWIGFCITINHSLAWANNNIKLSFLLGFFGGPLSYIAGQKLGVIIFQSNIYSLSILAFTWGISIAILFIINANINKNNLKDYTSIIITILFGIFFSILCSTNKMNYNEIPILLICLSISFIIHWIVFIPSFILKTEKYFDITGTLAFIVIFIFTYLFTKNIHFDSPIYLRSKIILFLITIWALRLGLFLFFRVLNAGEDKRFRKIKNSFSKFLVYFTVSSLWVFLTTCNALTLILNNSPLKNDLFFIIGTILWITGFFIETLADEQKRRFRKIPENKDNFISTGLWKISRHPNYFGEIIIWISIAIISLPILSGWQYLTLISPVFVYILLTKMSGINLLEQSADKKWGSKDSYLEYKKITPILIPFRKPNRI